MLIPEDRATEGLCLTLSIRDNISLGSLKRVSTWGVLGPKQERRLVNDMVERLQIVLRSTLQEAGSLSGGNQQKVLLGAGARAAAVAAPDVRRDARRRRRHEDRDLPADARAVRPGHLDPLLLDRRRASSRTSPTACSCCTTGRSAPTSTVPSSPSTGSSPRRSAVSGRQARERDGDRRAARHGAGPASASIRRSRLSLPRVSKGDIPLLMPYVYVARARAWRSTASSSRLARRLRAHSTRASRSSCRSRSSPSGRRS